jgi:isoleucyl-tRNA synthetase
MDEAYQALPYHKATRIVLDDTPVRTHEFDESVLKEFDSFKLVRDEVMKALEEARANEVIKSSQEAAVKLNIKDEAAKALYKSFTKEELNLYFIVSSVDLVDEKLEKDYNLTTVSVSHHQGEKCETCWNYFDVLFEVEGSHVCPRCKKVIA